MFTSPETATVITATDLLHLKLQRFEALNSHEVRAEVFCAWVRAHLKLGADLTNLEILQTMAPHFFIWCAAWTAKS